MRRGVAPGMSRWEAQRRCPRLVIATSDPGKYEYFWRRVVEICGDYSPQVRSDPSRHEASLDLTGTERLFGPARAVAQELRNRLRGEIGVEAAIGVGSNATIARLASGLLRPGEVTEILPKDVTEFVGRLPIASLPGVEAEWARWLSEMGLRLAKDLAALPADAVVRALGERGRRVWEIAQGHDPDERASKLAGLAETEEEAVSSHVDLLPPTEDRAQVRAALRISAEEVGRQLRQRGEVARQVRIEIVFRDLRKIELRRTLQHATRSGDIFCQVARALFDHTRLSGRLVRRVKVRAMRLTLDQHGGQLPLPLLEEDARRERLAEMVDRVKDRFGEAALRRASSLRLPAR
jgi:DNA polymerase IV